MILRRLIRPLFSTIGLCFMVPLVLSIIIWFFGPLAGWGDFRPMDTIAGRIVAIAVVWVLAMIVLTIILLVRRRRNKKMTEEIVEAVDESPEDEIIAGELGDLRTKLRTAMSELRKSKLGRRSLYELPWYIIIGPPGAGKTTAIVNSGLNFPLADSMGKTAIGGVGGTRNCDWWFTDEAVLIDTAGRYTTQDSDADMDNAGWVGFLNLLKKYRKRQPINGAIIAISVSDLSMQDAETQKSHARAVSRRLHELRERLGVRFPVYVLFTKADLIAGFAEFYDDLGKEEREQVWGFTLPLRKRTKNKEAASPVAAFDEQFALLLGRLNAQSLAKMQSESDHQRRSLVAGFPGQVASVRQVAREFLTEVFKENRYEHQHNLRGVYFTSGTQEGTPIDRLMMGMARTFGIGRQAIGSGRGTGRSYFLTRLFEEVMFPEAGLVSADDKVERRYRWSLRGAIAATVLIAAGSGALWTSSYLGNRSLVAETDETTSTYINLSAQIPPSPIEDTDLPSILPALNTLRDIPVNAAIGEYDAPRTIKWGLYQGEVMGDQVHQSYRAALNTHLLPRLLLSLEERMQANINAPDTLYDILKVYLMLGQQGPLNQDFVTEFMAAEWEKVYPGLSALETRTQLSEHLTTLLSEPMVTIDLNGPLVEHVREALALMPMAQRIYKGILNSTEATQLAQRRFTEIGGTNITRVMTRSSGEPLTDGIPGIFTRRGFFEVFLLQAVGVSTKIRNESWVLGDAAGEEPSTDSLVATARDVLNLYYDDYVAAYDRVLADLDIIPLEALAHAVEVTNVLSGPSSPIRIILETVSEETQLQSPPPQEEGTVNAEGLLSAGQRIAAIQLDAAFTVQEAAIFDALAGAGLSGDGAGADPERQPGYYVQNRFAWLHNLTLSENGAPSGLDTIIDPFLRNVYEELQRHLFSGGIAETPPGQVSAVALFQQEAKRVGGPLERWSTQITTGSAGITAEGTRAQLNAQWQGQVAPFCEQALSNRYPFTRGARNEVKLADFSRLFSPEGLINGFFDQNLRRYVDTQSRPWAWKAVNGSDLGMSDAVLQQFQYAAQIRDAFFAGAPQPQISFDVKPFASDAQMARLEIDGQTSLYDSAQPLAPTKMTWPGQQSFARITLEPPNAQAENTLSRDGDWAWFRLLDAAQVRKTPEADKRNVIFNVGGRAAVFELRAGSVLSPFSLPALQSFKCPQSL